MLTHSAPAEELQEEHGWHFGMGLLQLLTGSQALPGTAAFSGAPGRGARAGGSAPTAPVELQPRPRRRAGRYRAGQAVPPLPLRPLLLRLLLPPQVCHRVAGTARRRRRKRRRHEEAVAAFASVTGAWRARAWDGPSPTAGAQALLARGKGQEEEEEEEEDGGAGCVRERGDELSSVSWSRLRRPGSLPASLAAAAMAHSPVQAGLPGMQVSSCPKGRHGHSPRAAVDVKGGVPAAGGTGRDEEAPLGPGSAAGAVLGQRSEIETKRAVSAWRGAQRGPSARGIPACPCLPPSALSSRCVAAGVRSGAWRVAPSPGRAFSSVFEFLRRTAAQWAIFGPVNLRWVGKADLKPVRTSGAWKC